MWGIDAVKTEERLNAEVREVTTSGVSFVVHYWGVTTSLSDNMRHRHSFFEACLVIGGEARYQDETSDVLLRPGMLFLSRPGVVHQIHETRNLDLVYVAYDIQRNNSDIAWVELHHGLATASESDLQNFCEPPVVNDIWQSLCVSVDAGITSAVCRSLAAALLAAIPEALLSHAAAPPSSLSSSAQHPAVKRAVQFVNDNLEQALPLTAMSAYIGVSERHLSRLFHEAFGVGYNHWLTETRINKARTLLLDTDLPIKEIAELCGYSSVHYFTNVFKRWCLDTPAAYRRQHSVYSPDSGHRGTIFESLD